MKGLSDYIRWRVKDLEPATRKVDEWRPPVPSINYDKPQTDVLSHLDRDPIVRRVLVNPRVPPPRALPFLGSPVYQFLAGLWTGAMVTFIFTSKPLGRKEVEDLVKYDPAYFPEFASKNSH